MRRLLAGLAAACVAASALGGGTAPPAHADGDPCSDFLLQASLCVPLDRPSQPQIDRLQKTIDYAKAKGFPVRVAVIQSKQDLGSNPEYLGLPGPYAKLLSAEIQFAYKGRVLVAMQKGYAAYDHIKADSTGTKALKRLALPADDQPDTLTAAANEAVRKWAAAEGVKVPEFKVQASVTPPANSTGGGGASGGGGTSTRTFLLLLAGGLVVLAVVIGGILFWPAGNEDDEVDEPAGE